MIHEDWLPHRRAQDGELAGYLVPAAGAPGRFAPVTIIGTIIEPETGPLPEAEARALVEARGLEELHGRWWAELPAPLLPGVLDAANPVAGWEWRLVVIVEADDERCVIRPQNPAREELASSAVLPVPVGELLRPE